jgi:hypothetical protein
MSQSTFLYKYSHVIYGQTPGGFHGSELFLLFKLPIRTDPVTDSVSDTQKGALCVPRLVMSPKWAYFTKRPIL